MFKRIFLVVTLFISLCFVVFDGFYILPPAKELQDFSIQNSSPKSTNKSLGAYIINLDRASKRLNYIMPQVKALGVPVTRIAAIEGAKISDQEFETIVDIKAYTQFMGSRPRKGTIGCSLSHIKTWETFLKSNHDYALIFEDDVSFDPNLLKETLDAILKDAAQNPKLKIDIISFELLHRGMPLKIHTISNTNQSLCVYLNGVTDAGCYLISREGAAKLLAKARPIKIPVDHYFTRSWELDLNFCGVEPRIVKQTYGDSQINTSAKFQPQNDAPQNLLNKIIGRLSRGTFVAKTAIMNFTIRLKDYVLAKIDPSKTRK